MYINYNFKKVLLYITHITHIPKEKQECKSLKEKEQLITVI